MNLAAQTLVAPGHRTIVRAAKCMIGNRILTGAGSNGGGGTERTRLSAASAVKARAAQNLASKFSFMAACD
jgi:hypothetical protein